MSFIKYIADENHYKEVLSLVGKAKQTVRRMIELYCCHHLKQDTMPEEYQHQIREIMRWAGPRMIFYSPIAAINHLLGR